MVCIVCVLHESVYGFVFFFYLFQPVFYGCKKQSLIYSHIVSVCITQNCFSEIWYIVVAENRPFFSTFPFYIFKKCPYPCSVCVQFVNVKTRGWKPNVSNINYANDRFFEKSTISTWANWAGLKLMYSVTMHHSVQSVHVKIVEASVSNEVHLRSKGQTWWKPPCTARNFNLKKLLTYKNNCCCFVILYYTLFKCLL